RYPFFVASAINVVALFGRLRILVAPEYERLFAARSLSAAPISETISANWRTICIAAFAPLASFAMFHMVTVFPLTCSPRFTHDHPAQFLLIEAGAAAVGVLALVYSGRLADRFGRRTVLAASAGAIAVFSGFAPQLLAGGEVGEI